MPREERTDGGRRETGTDGAAGLLSAVDRRGFLAGLGGTASAALLGSSLGSGTASARSARPDGRGEDDPADRLVGAYNLRQEAALDLLREDADPTVATARFERKHGTFTKGLPHDEFGEVHLDAYAQLDEALTGTDLEAYNRIPLGGDRGLANPVAAHAFNLQGADGHQEPMPDPPAVGSDVAAAEMVELYWRALLRDVPFEAYDSHPLARAARDELAALDGYEGPTERGPYRDLFRVDYEGVRQGPYISQFLLQDCPYATMQIRNTLQPQTEGKEFLTTFEEWLAVRRGADDTVGSETLEDDRRRLTTGRDLLTYIHRNIPAQSAQAAAFYLVSEGYPLDVDLQSTLDTQNAFAEFGPPTVTALVSGVVNNVKHGTWYNKWLAHRRARPEKYGGLVHVHRSDKDRTYGFLHDDLLTSEALRRTHEEHGTWLLPQGYPEGSPTHPSYPAGHATFIGASVTVLKALFDGGATLEKTVRVTLDGSTERTDETLTVRGELNKLAMNHALGRDFAGIHYRTDGREGHLLGERVALAYLRDELRRTAVETELHLVGFTGEEIVVTQDEVRRTGREDGPATGRRRVN